MDNAQNTMIASNEQRSAACTRDIRNDCGALAAVRAAVRLHIILDGIGRPLPNLVTLEVNTAHARLRGERDAELLAARRLDLAELQGE